MTGRPEGNSSWFGGVERPDRPDTLLSWAFRFLESEWLSPGGAMRGSRTAALSTITLTGAAVLLAGCSGSQSDNYERVVR